MDKSEAISFDLPAEQADAIRALAADRRVRIAGEVKQGRLVIDAVSFANETFGQSVFLPVNAPFMTQELAAV